MSTNHIFSSCEKGSLLCDSFPGHRQEPLRTEKPSQGKILLYSEIARLKLFGKKDLRARNLLELNVC